MVCKLWKISNLETLIIEGQAWVKPISLTSPYVSAMLKASPALQVSIGLFQAAVQ